MAKSQYCAFFDEPIKDRNLLGGKGAGLVEMTGLGLPVPPGFTIMTTAWRESQKKGGLLYQSIWREVRRYLELLEKKTGESFGSADNPLFVSVRSGAPISMPGILETKINLGINDETTPFLEETLGVENALRIRRSFPKGFPEDPFEQIRLGIQEVFDSWNTPKAKLYREKHGIRDIGTAVTIQKMVWGNSLKAGAGTGVLLTRDTQKYSDEAVVTFARNAQGPSVVDAESLYAQVPVSKLAVPEDIRTELKKYALTLEKHFNFEPQDIEFTYDGNKLWVLQTRNAPLSPLSNLRSKIDRIKKGAIKDTQAIAAIPTTHLNALVEPSLDSLVAETFERNGRLIGEGLSVSIGSKTGFVATSLENALKYEMSDTIVLADANLESFAQLPENVHAVLLEKAGVGSHLAREGTQLSSEKDLVVIFGVRLAGEYEGQVVTVDGNTGKVFAGEVPLAEAGGGESLLTSEEKKTAALWLTEKRENPWKFMVDNPDFEKYEQKIRESLKKADELGIRSLKAREITVFNAGIPEKIRQTYTVIKVDSPDKLIERIRPILTKIFASGHHATIRTCHNPALLANGPWALVRNMDNFEQFLVDDHYSPKYGGFRTFLANPQLTELLIGNIPVGKMEADPKIQYNHCAWTLSCLDNGKVILQVHAHNPHLREHEKAKREDLITYTTQFDPKSGNRLAPVETEIGENLLHDGLAQALGEIARKNIFDKWWTEYNLPQRMAAITKVLGINATFEGQATKSWCLGYGIKTR